MSTSNNSRRLRSPPLEPLNELLVHDFRQFSLIISPKPSGSSREQRRPFLFCDDATFDSESRPSLLLSDDGTSDGSSILSYSTASSSSTVKGVGMVSGRLIKALGRRTLEAAENLNIRRRLAAIRNMVQTKPAVFLIRRYAEGSQGSFQKERKAALDAIDDLRELYGYAKDIRKTALHLKQDIADIYLDARTPLSPTFNNWKLVFLVLGLGRVGKTTFVKVCFQRGGLNRSLHSHVIDQMQTSDIKAVLETMEEYIKLVLPNPSDVHRRSRALPG